MKLFFSYASIDQIEYRVDRIVDFLEFQDNIKHVFYWERDTKGGQAFDAYMRENIKASDLVIVLFTPNTRSSIPVIEEIGIAKAFQKQLLPIFVKIDNVFANIQSSRGVKYKSDFRMFCEDLYHKITGKIAKFKESDPLMELRKEMHDKFQFKKLQYVEPELRDITGNLYKSKEIKKQIPLISYRIFKFILFDPLNRDSLNIILAPSGSGKSVFLDSIKHDILHIEQLYSYIPFAVPAKELPLVKDNLLEEIYDYVFPDTEKRYFNNFNEFINSGKSIFLLDGLSENSNPLKLLEKLYDFINANNARIIITCRPVIEDYLKNSSHIEEKCHLYELNSFKSSSLFEWIVLNKNNFDQTCNYQAKEIYPEIKRKIKIIEDKGEVVVLPSLMQEISL